MQKFRDLFNGVAKSGCCGGKDCCGGSCEGIQLCFDNSTKNKSNPDPTREVRWGDQTWQEMMIGWFDYYYVNAPAE